MSSPSSSDGTQLPPNSSPVNWLPLDEIPISVLDDLITEDDTPVRGLS